MRLPRFCKYLDNERLCWCPLWCLGVHRIHDRSMDDDEHLLFAQCWMKLVLFSIRLTMSFGLHIFFVFSFADIVGFTSMSSSMKPIEVVELLNNLFSRFDELVDRYALNKVKTIGDCYMVTSVPGSADPGPKAGAICSFGLDMIQALHAYNAENPNKPLDLRVGVHSGPVVAGVVGTKRFLYVP